MQERLKSNPAPVEGDEVIENPEGARQKINFESIRGTKETVVNNKSGRAAEILSAYFGNRLTITEAEQAFKDLPDLEPAKIEALRRLERLGAIHHITHPDTKEKILVADTDYLCGMRQEDMEKLGPLWRRLGSKRKIDIFYTIFGDQKAITHEQEKRGDLTPNPLLYYPRDRAAAFSPEEVKKSEFHIAPWELSLKIVSPIGKEFYPVKDGPQVERHELMASTIILHPRYGDGYRDKKNRLMIRRKDSREYAPISSDELARYGVHLKTSSTAGKLALRNVRQAVREFLPNLVSKSILLPEDLVVSSVTAYAEKERIFRTKVSPDGMVIFNGVKHYIGRRFIDKSIRIYPLTRDLGVIVGADNNGNETMAYTFRIFPREHFPSKKSGYAIAKKKDTELAIFDPEKISLPRRADEPEEKYRERIDALKKFGSVLKLSNDLTPLGIFINKDDIKEQTTVAKAAEFLTDKGEYSRFLSFARLYREDGIRTLFAAEYDNRNVKKILELGEALKESEADSLFYAYSRTIAASSILEKMFGDKTLNALGIPEDLKERLPVEVKEAILRGSTDVLLASYASAVEKKGDIKTEDVLKSLEGIQIFLEILQALEETDSSYRILKSYERNEALIFLAENKNTGELYELKIFIRPHADKHGQARINFELDFDTIKPNKSLRNAFEHEITYKLRKNTVRKLHSLRIAIDRDTHEGITNISLDLGRGALDGETQKRTGDILGRVLQLTTELGYHNPKSFDKRFADETIFSQIAECFKEYIESKNP